MRGEFIDPNVAAIRGANRGCPGIQVHAAFGGMGGQARRVDPIFPHQSREAVRNFNDAAFSYVSATHSLPSFDYLELTRDAMTSDGVHFLSDVNLVKAAYLVHWLDLVSGGDVTRPSPPATASPAAAAPAARARGPSGP